MALLPWDVNQLLGGATRILRAPLSEPVPADISEIIGMEDPYDPVGTWVDFGATREGASYNRSIDEEGLEIQQVTGAVLTEITEVVRTVNLSIAEIKAEHLQIIEEAPAVDAVAAAAFKSAQQKVAFGSINDLTQYRIAFIAQRNRQSGEVTESDGTTVRGRLVCGVLYRAQITADDVEVPLEKGELAHAPVAFQGFPEPGQPENQDFGAWFTEDAGTIAAV